MTLPFPAITDYTANSLQTKNSTNNSGDTLLVRKPDAKQARHASGRFDKSSSDVSNPDINFVKKHSNKDRLCDELKNVHFVQNVYSRNII